MTARIGTMSVDGTPISRTDLARIEAEEKLHSEQQRRAVRVVAGTAHDADDCRVLLSILGLDPAMAMACASPAEVSATPAQKRPRKRRAA